MRRTSSKTSSLRPNDIFNEEKKPWRLLQREAEFVSGLFLSAGQLQALTACGILTRNPRDYHGMAMLTTRFCDRWLTRARLQLYICHKCEVQIKNHKTKHCLYWQHILTSPHTQMTGFTLLVNQPSRIPPVSVSSAFWQFQNDRSQHSGNKSNQNHPSGLKRAKALEIPATVMTCSGTRRGRKDVSRHRCQHVETGMYSAERGLVGSRTNATHYSLSDSLCPGEAHTDRTT
ncbi:hypothetical protein QQF64_009344 [Cirrhinus molitorella]|uniref:Uncharacterized protein n=1 Tax=Cirrhinus molitorella TaxID=172907 RepID=A0ABR3M0X5_9TELE